MRRVRLPGTELETSAIGFGCASVMGRVGRRTALDAMAQAFEAGITYFDVARAYGGGRAEEVLGEFLQGRRDRVCLATKFGILPPDDGLLLRIAKPVARRLMAAFPGTRSRVAMLGARAQPGREPRHFDVASARRSLDASLRALDVDHIDVLLLHSCYAEHLELDDLFEFLDERRREGSIGHYGISYEGADLALLLPFERPGIDVLQVPVDFRDQRTRELVRSQDLAVVTHSHFTRHRALESTRANLAANPETARRWSDRLGSDVLKPGFLQSLILADTLRENPRSVALCATFDPDHIASNAEAGAEQKYSDAVLDAFRELAGSLPDDGAD